MTYSSIRLNDILTDWFNVIINTGLKQGCPLPSLLFTLYINDLVTFIKLYNCSIDINNENSLHSTLCR